MGSGPVVLERLPVVADGTGNRAADVRRTRIYILPTRQGLVFLLMLVIMLLGAVNYNNSMAYLLTFLLAGLFMVCMIHTYGNLRGLLVTTPEPLPVFAGAGAHFPLLLENRTGRGRVALEITRRGEQVRGAQAPAPQQLNLPPGIVRDDLVVPAAARGLLLPGRVNLSTTHPLGLFRAWAGIEPDRHCIVYPRPAGDARLPLTGSASSEELTGTRAGTDDFTGFRPYQSWDSTRSIDWKKYASEQGLLIRNFSGSGSARLMLHWDLCARLPGVEARLSQLCLWILEADRLGCRYGLEIPGTVIEAGGGVRHKRHCLRALAEFGQEQRGA